jgi:hypothetical protein
MNKKKLAIRLVLLLGLAFALRFFWEIYQAPGYSEDPE